ncbi:hypothetical protein U1Q18_029781 [Sarracenia purpurea var. burkii]
MVVRTRPEPLKFQELVTLLNTKEMQMIKDRESSSNLASVFVTTNKMSRSQSSFSLLSQPFKASSVSQPQNHSTQVSLLSHFHVPLTSFEELTFPSIPISVSTALPPTVVLNAIAHTNTISPQLDLNSIGLSNAHADSFDHPLTDTSIGIESYANPISSASTFPKVVASRPTHPMITNSTVHSCNYISCRFYGS